MSGVWCGCLIRAVGTASGQMAYSGMKALPAAVARIGLQPGDPVFVAPDFTVDLDLLDFVRSKDFRSLERATSGSSEHRSPTGRRARPSSWRSSTS